MRAVHILLCRGVHKQFSHAQLSRSPCMPYNYFLNKSEKQKPGYHCPGATNTQKILRSIPTKRWWNQLEYSTVTLEPVTLSLNTCQAVTKQHGIDGLLRTNTRCMNLKFSRTSCASGGQDDVLLTNAGIRIREDRSEESDRHSELVKQALVIVLRLVYSASSLALTVQAMVSFTANFHANCKCVAPP